MLLLGLTFALQAQEKGISNSSENIVPNGSFERYSGIPLGWFYKGKHFTDVMKYWYAPTGASPDVFGPKVRIPKHWAEKGFGKQPPRTGNSMVGLTLYGCEDGKPHCREYIQIQLKEPLVVGQQYYFEFWVNRLPRSLKVNNLGGFFSAAANNALSDVLIEATPQVKATKVVNTPLSGWVRISGEFQAEIEANYLTIGNFDTDENTLVEMPNKNALTYAYYYVDDVLLRKEEPILEVPVEADDLTKISLEAGKVVTLKNIFFETDKYELLPRSFVELNKLHKLMQDHPNMVIEIRGHTDTVGKVDYNKYLSRKRAKAVVLFLIEQGINPNRLTYKGFGSDLPIAKNDTGVGRQLNRRVEFKILSDDFN
ncbi:MAG: OmpA family protein [Bacteroidota bacterium]